MFAYRLCHQRKDGFVAHSWGSKTGSNPNTTSPAASPWLTPCVALAPGGYSICPPNVTAPPTLTTGLVAAT